MTNSSPTLLPHIITAWLVAQSTGCTGGSADPGVPILTGSVSHMEVDDVHAGADLAAAAVHYLRMHESELGLSPAAGHVALELPAGFDGVRRARAQQLYQGLPVVGSTIDIRADADGFLGFSGTVTRNLDGFDIEPAISRDEAADLAVADRIRFVPIAHASADEVVAVELVVLPRTGPGADLAWQVELSVPPPDPETPPEKWISQVDARTGAVLAVAPAGDGCGFWDRLKCQFLPEPDKSYCLSEVCGGQAQSVCGDEVCEGDETDASCRQDCGCSATVSCDEIAPFGCWCDADCDASGDCCSDASLCYLPTGGDDDGTCEWGERSAGFFDRARLAFYRAKYYAAAHTLGRVDAPDARDLLLHFLRNSGAEVTVDVDKMLYDLPSFASKVEQDRIRYGEQAAAQARAENQTGTVTSGIPDETLAHSVTEAESLNWFAAIPSFEYKHVGEITVTRVGETFLYAVESVVVLRDKYDWSREEPNAGPDSVFKQSELDDMNCFGWGREFWLTGMSMKREIVGQLP